MGIRCITGASRSREVKGRLVDEVKNAQLAELCIPEPPGK
jgi:hypothetical protein